ncbi:pentapeptide repeat-containing protein [Streptomyces sp. Ru72]|uniref:pentapeptide repeat-containing protein n=1 Tax=Streptomyces sp. Ru72 TaxID=2080747 RepID=UPI0015E36ACF|nr:pentapeptide repeat-containing protein [Streptomyces sp. Ru72]
MTRLAEALRPREPEEEGGERGVRLRGADLAGGNLYHVRLPDADLEGTDLSRANLGFSDLRGARLDASALPGADLTGADLSGAHLARCDLSGAVLDDARLVGTDLSRARLASRRASTAWVTTRAGTGARIPRRPLVRRAPCTDDGVRVPTVGTDDVVAQLLSQARNGNAK